MDILAKKRNIDPFFNEAINQVFLQPKYNAFVMGGAVGLGKSSNFVMYGSYIISQSVSPIKKGKDYIRESKWVAVRDSENSAYATVMQVLENGVFSPEIMSMSNCPVKKSGSHPVTITIEHGLPDKTILKMIIECHGFNHADSYNRIKSHEYMGALVFELQGIPFNVFDTVIERCGRYRTDDLTIEREINGEKITLAGQNKTCIVLADLNIPSRPHPLYEKYYDKSDEDKKNSPYLFIDPPSPLLPLSYNKVMKNLKAQGKELNTDRYRVKIFKGEKTIWAPNPEAYFMTRHFEEKDDNGNNIPWTGYDYWFNLLHDTDNLIIRHVLGRPLSSGGDAVVYKKFDKDKAERYVEPDYNRDVYVGFDPGGYASFTILQDNDDNDIHVHKEFFFQPVDNESTRTVLSQHLFPYCEKMFSNITVYITPDPASSWLGKNKMVASTESVLDIIYSEIKKRKDNESNITYRVWPCIVNNQQVESRINSLGFYIDSQKITIDPECEYLFKGLNGDYHYIKLKCGKITENIDKKTLSSHVVESLQYPLVNLLDRFKRREKNKGKKNGFGKIKKLNK